MASSNQNSVTQGSHVNDYSIYNNYTYSVVNILSNLSNIQMAHDCSHCRTNGSHNIYNCNHVTLRIFENELFKKKEELLDSNEEHKLAAFEDFIYKFHIGIINGFHNKSLGFIHTSNHINDIVIRIMEIFWNTDIYENEWLIFNDSLVNGGGWFIDRLGSRTITENSFIYQQSLTNNYLLNRILMANLLMNEILVNESARTQLINIVNNVNIVNNINISNPPYQTQASQVSQVAQVAERKFNISAQLIIEDIKDIKDSEECAICYESKTNEKMIKLNCNHEFCGSCIIQTMNNTSQYKQPCCAFCRKTMTSFVIRNEEDFNIIQERIL